MPATPSVTYCSEDDLKALLSSVGQENRVDDDSSGTLSSPEQVYLDKARYWAKARVDFYCRLLYRESDLAESWLVNNWAVICGAYWLSCRRGNPPPGSFDDLYKEAVEDMKLVHSGQYQIPDIGLREVAWPAWSNVRVDQLYNLRRVRVQRPISEKSPTPYRQNRDWPGEFILEP